MNTDECMSHDCLNPTLRQGQRIVQIARGRCFGGGITSTHLDEVVGDWHEECYHGELTLEPQRMPYKCNEKGCGLPIVHGDEILYAVKGTKAAPGYIRPEGRGTELHYVRHLTCPGA
jgi:hypothetical protein